MRSTTRAGLFFGASAAFLVLASAAYACTTFVGQQTVTQGANSATSVGIGGNGGMAYCTTPPSVSLSSTGTTYTIGVSAKTGTCAGQLPATNSGLLGMGPTYKAYKTSGTDCMAGSGTAITGGGVTVNNSGFGQTASLAANTLTVGNTNLCISDSGAAKGMQSPVTVS